MSNIPGDLKYTDSHEWVRCESDGTITVGITDHAQEALGDLVYIELPEVGKHFAARKEMIIVESVKAASDVYAPVSGTVIEGNGALEGDPALVNNDPEGEGWFFKITLSDTSELDSLMDAAAYKAFVDGL
jgi:glycine cleavage system H protein